jgi:3-oxoacyl-(acyl-carrier-protein) synthase
MSSKPRIVITGLGLTAPNGNSLGEFRANLLAGKARIAVIDVRHMGKHPLHIFLLHLQQGRESAFRRISCGHTCASQGANLDAFAADDEMAVYGCGLFVHSCLALLLEEIPGGVVFPGFG